MDVTTNILLRLYCEQTLTADLNARPSSTLNFTFSDKLTDGTGVDQADLVYFDSNTAALGATTTYDLHTSLTDIYGVAADFARVKAVAFENTSALAASVLDVGPHAHANPFQGMLTTSGGATGSEAENVRYQGAFVWFTPDATAWAVGNGATDVIEIVEAGGVAAAWDIMFVGATA